MGEEYINYKDNLPINIELASIRNYPIAWQDSTKILFVLDGMINVTMGNEVYRLNKKELEIINKGEIYSIEASEDNLVLILDIRPDFFESYSDGVENIYYYTNSLDGSNQWDAKYRSLRRYISILFYELLSKNDDYEDKIEKILIEMMYHLLNNFHHLFYEEESLREDDLQFERFSRIINYIRENYNTRVSLKEIAEREYLTSQYLSYKIKDTFGQSFNDFVNQIRIEESRKLLLATDKSISEIAMESGFSHSRYYNKHFKNIYGKSPIKYREDYQRSQEEKTDEKSISYYDIKNAEDYLKEYLLDYERYEISKLIVKKHIDLEDRIGEVFIRPSIINLGDASLILEEEYKNYLEEIQEDIGFKYCLLNNLFSRDTDIFIGENRFINWTRVENILETIEDLGLIPLMELDNIDEFIKKDFMENVDILDIKDISKEKFRLEKRLDFKVEVEENQLNDSLEMVSYLAYNQAYLNRQIILQMADEITKHVKLENDSFFGGNGIITTNGLKKPSYFALMFLSKMGEDIIYREEGVLVTSSDEGYEILLYNPANLKSDKTNLKKLSLNISNLNEDYLVTKYELSEKYGSVYDKWLSLGGPERLSNDIWNLLNKYSLPRIEFKKVRRKNIYNIVTSLKPHSLVLYEFKKI